MSSASPLAEHHWRILNDGVNDNVRELRFYSDSFYYRHKGARYGWHEKYPHCTVEPCAVCKRLLSPARLHYASFPYRMNDATTQWLHWHVCFGCLSKFRSIHRKYELFRDIKRAIEALERAIRHVR